MAQILILMISKKSKIDIILLEKLKYTLKYLERSDAKFISKDLKSEIKYLLEALNSLVNLKIKVSKFDSFNFKSEIRKRCWTVSYIKQRLLNAGFEPNRNN